MEDAAGSATRTLTTVAATIHTAQERKRLGREALAAETLRASDAIRITILRTVSHDLRSPLDEAEAAAARALGEAGTALATAPERHGAALRCAALRRGWHASACRRRAPRSSPRWRRLLRRSVG